MRNFHEAEDRTDADSPINQSLDFDLTYLSSILRQNIILIFSFIGIALTLATIYLFVTPKQYTATAVLLIDSRANTFSSQQVRVTDANSDSANVESQVEILRSEKISRAVIQSERLTEHPDFRQGSTNILGRLIYEMSLSSEADQSDPSRFASAIKQFRNATTIRRSTGTYVVEIGFRSTDAALAARIANAIAVAYVTDQLSSREEGARKASQWLQQRALELRREAQDAQKAVEDLQTRGLVNDGGSGRVALRDLESRAQTYRTISETFLQRFLETSQQQSFTVPDARVASEAWPPAEPSHPRANLTLAVAAALGTAIGFAVALMRKNSRPKKSSTGNLLS